MVPSLDHSLPKWVKADVLARECDGIDAVTVRIATSGCGGYIGGEVEIADVASLRMKTRGVLWQIA